jgi:outer membrane protein OmpA-like peptidoglycan-associated protein
MGRHVLVACVMTLALAAGASAQTGSSGTSTGQNTSGTRTQSSGSDDRRPATTTFFGDTGLWFVPTAEVLAHGKWSVSAYRRGTNYIQGYTNVADFAGTFAYGIGDRTEIFGSFLFDTRIDRDTRPVFIDDPTFGGIIDRYPKVNQYWTGDNVGDLYIGAKVNVWSEGRQKPVAIAVRGLVKVPTGKASIGVSTGKADVFGDFIVSKEAAKAVDVSGYAGYQYAGSPEGFTIPTGAFRWGGGAGFPSRSPLRVSTELNGIVPSATTAMTTAGVLTSPLDGTRPPLISNTEDLTRATVALTFQAPNGFFIGGGVSWSVPQLQRNYGLTQSDDTPGVVRDYWDWQVRIGFHPGVRVYVPPPPRLPPPPPPPSVSRAAVVHELLVKAACNPCTVDVGKTTTVTPTVQDSLSCAVTYRWTAPAGTLANPTERQTLWTAPQQPGSVPLTVTVTCPTDGKTAFDTITVQVVRPVAKSLALEDVHFDFDRYSLRPEAAHALDDVINALKNDPTLRVQVEGHTCNIGTPEYNLALGDRRAKAVRDYLMSRGVPMERLTTISYGEEHPKFENTREETRRLNRRAALVVNLQ